jgi:hypothetical protein
MSTCKQILLVIAHMDSSSCVNSNIAMVFNLHGFNHKFSTFWIIRLQFGSDGLFDEDDSFYSLQQNNLQKYNKVIS